MRITVFGLNESGKTLEPIFGFPRDISRKEIGLGNTERDRMRVEDLSDPAPFRFVSPVNGNSAAPAEAKLRSYDQFISSTVRSGAGVIYGLLTVDSEGSDTLVERDGRPTHGYASATAFMYEAMSRGERGRG